MSIFREFNISMIPGKPPLIIHVSQYESDFVYTFHLVSGKSVLAIPDTAIAVIRGTKRDGNGFSKEASLDTENNKVVVIGEAQMTACAGKNVFELAIINDEKVICTANFFLDVERAPLDSDTIRSDTVLHDLQAIINSAATATQAAEEASASAAEAAESARTLTIDPTLTQSGQAADAKVVGDRIEGKVSKPTSSPNGTAGQLLRTNGDGTTQWVDQGLPTDEQTAEAIDEWLTDHPEATTTVQDGSITEAKLTTALKPKVLKDYVTPQMFGAVGDGATDDTTAVINTFINSNYVFFPAGIYLCDWSAVNLTGKTVFGEGNGLTVIKQKNANVPFCVMGENGILKDITLVTYNNTVETPVIIMGVYNGVFNRFGNYLIDRVQITANDNYTLGILYNIDKHGGIGGELTNSVITGCLDGIRIDLASNTNNLGWLTRDSISTVFIRAPKRIGFHINNKGIRYQLSHNIYSGISVQLTLNNTTGIKLDYGGYVLDSPYVFNDTNGDATGIDLYYSSIDSVPQNITFNKVNVTFSPIVMNAFIEGDVVGFENNYVYKIFNLKTPTGANSNYGDMPLVFYSETGAINLFDVLKNHTVGETSERSGVEFTFNADETISMVGTSTDNIGECYLTLHNGPAEDIGLDKDKYYRFSCSHGGIVLMSYDSGNVATYLIYNMKTAVAKIPNDSVRILFRLGGNNGVTYNEQVRISITSPYITNQNISFKKYAMSNRMLTEQIRDLEARIAQLET